MNVFCLGINHRTAPVELREKLWFSLQEVRTALEEMKGEMFREMVLMSTCNRTELYYVPKELSTNGEPLWMSLARRKNAPDLFGESNFYALSSTAAVKHLFSVSSGIDSMVLGDVQILSQIKEAFMLAQDTRATGILLNRLFNTAFHVGKRARTETEIGEGAVSVSYAAAEVASKIFEDLGKRTALLIGAGETGKLTAKHLAGRNLGRLLLANRTRKRAEDLVEQLGGSVVEFGALAAELPHVDIVISAVESPSYIFSAQEIRQAMRLRANRPLFIIDIGVPRNVDPAANHIDNVFLNDIDALHNIVDRNLEHRKAEIPKIQRIILDELTQFKVWYDSLEVNPTIQQLRERFESIRQSEFDKHRHQFPADKQETVEILTKRIVNKILHTPMVNLRNGSPEHASDETRTKIAVLRHLFGLDKKAAE